jgi:guanylate kinase
MSGDSAGRVVVVSGPSGAGKTTVMREVFRRSTLPLVPSVSATTRPPRPGEVDGVDYHFLTPEEFHRRRQRGEFLECFEVFGRGHWYGTLQSQVDRGLAAGKWVVLEIDVQGAMQVMEKFPDAISIFIRPSTLEALGERLRHRGTETEEAISSRLARAEYEMRFAPRYRYQVINDDLQRAVEEVCHILEKENNSLKR